MPVVYTDKEGRERFLDRLQFVTGCNKKEATDMYNSFIAVLISEVEQGHDVTLPYFGRIWTRVVEPYLTTNMYIDKPVAIRKHRRIVFKPSHSLRRRVRNVNL